MKKYFVNIIASLMIILATLSSCKDKEDDNNTVTPITMITEISRISLDIAGSGEVTIEWGDGTSETYTLSNNWKNPYSPLAPKTHEYSGTSTHIITITGENITHLYCNSNELTDLDVSKNTTLTVLFCGYNQLTDLDVSRNTVLTYLYCSYNLLSTDALNALFRTLHSNMIDRKALSINNNPGTDTCDQMIATDKGWSFW